MNDLSKRGLQQIGRALFVVTLLTVAGAIPNLYAAGSSESSSEGEPVAYVTIIFADDISQIEVRRADGSVVTPSLGDRIFVGDSIATAETFAEVVLVPTDVLIKMAPETELSVDSLRGIERSRENAVGLTTGRIRTLTTAAFLRGGFSVVTPLTVAGVRGTQFVNIVERDESDQVVVDRTIVREGVVRVERRRDGSSVRASAGEEVDGAADRLATRDADDDDFDDAFDDMEPSDEAEDYYDDDDDDNGDNGEYDDDDDDDDDDDSDDDDDDD